jgi:adenosylcobyric acid synthase
MMAGKRIADPHRMEGIGGSLDGLGLLALDTAMGRAKTTKSMRVQFQSVADPWADLSNLAVDGYEIRYGVMTGTATAVADGVWVNGNVLATTVHGMFENPAVVESLTGIRPRSVLEETFDLLADAVDEHLDTSLLCRLVGLG